MDFFTILGLGGGAALIYAAAGPAAQGLVNSHGVLIVLGGTLCATMVNSSSGQVLGALSAALTLLRGAGLPAPDGVVGALVALADQARRSGTRSIQARLRDVPDGGFLAWAADVAMTAGDAASARATLERAINSTRQRHREVGNTLRTLGALAPMFGLLGTLIGIVSVLRTMSDPASVGPAMAVAISSAFYGILLSNLLFVPMAGKLRSRSAEELLLRELAMEAVLDIYFTNRVPLVVELRLRAFLEHWGEARPAVASASASARQFPAAAEA